MDVMFVIMAILICIRIIVMFQFSFDCKGICTYIHLSLDLFLPLFKLAASVSNPLLLTILISPTVYSCHSCNVCYFDF